MFSYDSKLKLKEVFLAYGEDEIAIEKQRQILAAIKEFEPYASFQRIDREGCGFITAKNLHQFLRENGYRDFAKENCRYLIHYFDQDNDRKLNYHE